MKILFVYLYDVTPYFPLGIGSMSAVLRDHGHSTRLSYLAGDGDISELLHQIEEFDPQVLAFSSVSSSFPAASRAAVAAKRHRPELVTLCGGVHTTLSPHVICETRGFDGVCVGEGEYALLELVDAMESGRDYTRTPGFWFSVGSDVIRNEMRPLIQDLDLLPPPDREIFRSRPPRGFDRERGDFMFCRGCPFSCTYCSNHALKELYKGQKYVRYRSVEKAIEELIQDTTQYNLSWLVIHDDIISLNRTWFRNFLQEYAEKVKIPFICNVRPGTCTIEMFRLLKQANCRSVAIGIESGCSYIREGILNRKMTEDQILETFSLAHQAGLETFSYNMVGLPHETPARFAETVRLNARLGSQNSPWIYIFHPYPGTSLNELCQREELIGGRQLGLKERKDTTLKLPGFSRRAVMRYYHDFRPLIRFQRRADSSGRFSLDRLMARLMVHPELVPLIRLYDFIRRIPALGIHQSILKITARLKGSPRMREGVQKRRSV